LLSRHWLTRREATEWVELYQGSSNAARAAAEAPEPNWPIVKAL
jgi:hypothetical protein